MSDSVRPHRQQPTRLPHPWDSPGKNTGVGCHFLLQCMKVKSESEVAQSFPTLSDPWLHGLQPTRLLCPWDFPGKSTGVGCHCLGRYINRLGCVSIKLYLQNRQQASIGPRTIVCWLLSRSQDSLWLSRIPRPSQLISRTKLGIRAQRRMVLD